MTTVDDKVTPTRDELIGQAAELQPLLRDHAEYGDQHRRTADDVIQALTDAGMFRLFVPRRFGGYECDPGTLIRVAEVLGAGDACAAWLVGACATAQFCAAFASDRAQHELFGTNPDVRIAGGGSGMGTAVRTAGGVRVTGSWAWASGAPHASWALGTVTMPQEGDGPRQVSFALMPAADLQLADTWHTTGMRGTGSATWIAEDVFVPEHRIVGLSALQGGTLVNPGPLYKVPFMLVGGLDFAGALLGTADAALAYVVDSAAIKGVTHTVYAHQSDSVGVQVRIGEAALKIRSARLHVHSIADRLFADARAGRAVESADFAGHAAELAFSARALIEAVGIVVDVHGASALALTSPLQRYLRDINTGARHPAFNATVGAELLGKSLLGRREQVIAGP